MKELNKEYVRVVRSNGHEWKYHFIYSHSEPLNIEHISGNVPEYIRYNSKERHIYIEDASLRENNIIDASACKKRGRPKGSKDGYKRTRNNNKWNWRNNDILSFMVLFLLWRV